MIGIVSCNRMVNDAKSKSLSGSDGLNNRNNKKNRLLVLSTLFIR